jgi:phage repressor protein C with HTH and peptisase S24 domain
MSKWKWLRDYMRQNKISQQDAAEALNWKKPRISELLCGKRDLPVDKVLPAAQFFNLDLEALTKFNSGFSNEIPQPTQKSSTTDEQIFFADIIDCATTEGKGLSAPVVGQYPISKNFFNNLGSASIHSLKAIIVRGDTMLPTVCDKDIAIVDTSITKPEYDGIYLFELQGELFIKRLCFNEFEHNAQIISDNPLYPPITISNLNKLSCLAKVVAILKILK